WLKEFDCQVGLRHNGQSVILLLNKCSSHKLDFLNLQYVDIHFLPTNTTSKIQLMDAAIRYTIQAWKEIDDLATMIENLYFSDPMQVKEFLSISNKNIVYEIPDDDHTISELIEIFKKSDDIEDSDVVDVDEMDDSLEVPMISANSALE
ncbi:4291_t:CDS:2, partial [Racocetra persica]